MQGNNHAKLHIFFVLTTSNAELLYQSPLKKGVIAKKQPPKPRNLSLRSFLLHFLLLKSGINKSDKPSTKKKRNSRSSLISILSRQDAKIDTPELENRIM